MPEDPRTDRVGGPRHYAGAEVSAPFVWACPACGAKNTTPFSEGCPACGSGKNAAKHVGVDPIAPPRPKVNDAEKQAYPTRVDLPLVDEYFNHFAFMSFLFWVDQQQPRPRPEQQAFLWRGFQAGWKICQTRVHDSVMMEVPHVADVSADPRYQPVDSSDHELPVLLSEGAATTLAEPAADRESATGLPGTARDRTLLAALIFFKDQVLAQRPEEIVTGEWSAEDVDTMIAEVQERLND